MADEFHTEWGAREGITHIYNRDSRWLWSHALRTNRIYLWRPPDPQKKHGVAQSTRVLDYDGDGVNDVLRIASGNDLMMDFITLLNIRHETILRRSIPSFDVPKSIDLVSTPSSWVMFKWTTIRWHRGDLPRAIVAFHLLDQQFDRLGWCVLGELKQDFNGYEELFSKKDWWFTLEALPNSSGGEWLWAGSLTPDGAPLIAIFRDGLLNDGEWPPRDTSVIRLYRFPVDPAAKALYRRSFTNSLNDTAYAPSSTACQQLGTDTGKSFTHNVYVPSKPERGVKAMVRTEGASSRLDHGYWFTLDGEYRGLELSWMMWGDRLKIIADEKLVVPTWTCDECSTYLDRPQIWDGMRWVPIDPANVLPDSCYSAGLIPIEPGMKP